MTYSNEAAAIWNEYADEFERRWGIDREVSAIVGARSRRVFDAEFKEHGDHSYRISVLLPIRNAFYSASAIDERWAQLRDMNLREPILDYGCGVGFQLLWLKRRGFSRLCAYEIDGIQRDVMLSVLGRNGISEWDGGPVETVLCTNVLEHVKDPVGLLEKLLLIGRRVIANVDTSHQECHIASHRDMETCQRMLEERGTLYRAA